MEQLRQEIEDFHQEYLSTDDGKEHLRTTSDTEPRKIKRTFADIREMYQRGDDITDAVLRRLLPHFNSEYHRENDYHISTWPSIRKDIRGWFEGIGWKKPSDWQPTAKLLFEAIDGVIRGDWNSWEYFLESDYRRGFGTGMVTPILFCLDNQFPVINSKVVHTYRFITQEQGNPDTIDAKLDNYRENADKVIKLQESLVAEGLDSLAIFDIFCHYHVISNPKSSKTDNEPDYDAWFFVANPDIFEWQTAFEAGGVEWTGSRGHYAQKLLRERLKSGDRVFGYQAGPEYAITCELEVDGKPFKSDAGKWAVTLLPVRQLPEPISLSTLKNHPILSNIKFVQQTQISISGITKAQLQILDNLIEKPEIRRAEISEVDKLCADLEEAQYDTKNHQRFEALLAQAFEFLGFEAEHIGGPGDTDILLRGYLGPDSYSAVVDAKTRASGSALNNVIFDVISQHREQHTAEYAMIVAPSYSGGNLQQFAINHQVALLTTEHLIQTLRLHAQFPFGADDLRLLFQATTKPDVAIKRLMNLHNQHEELLDLTSVILDFFDSNQRQSERSETIISNSLFWYLKGNSRHNLDMKQIESVLELLSNPVLNVLSHDGSTYVLTVSPDAARSRLDALVRMLVGD